ncbi:MAG: glycine--tRNA ligase [Phycisphaeraceae bacterium]|nr:glycine--tRNA ligase [Phycisphaeraceae bacterium]MCW5763121.1 glycine--tRNA ligase [Phycisphaeraceae bacterium]
MPEHAAKSMDDIVSLCKRRGFIFPASEIYGGINGFWDYGPLGTQLKKNLRDAWWQDVVMNPCCGMNGPNGQPVDIVPLETCIIQNPKVWEASGHLAGFADPMRKCAGCGHFVRADHLWEILATNCEWLQSLLQEFTPVSGEIDSPRLMKWAKGKGKKLAPNLALVRNPELTLSWLATRVNGQPDAPPDLMEIARYIATEQLHSTGLQDPCPRCGGPLGTPAPFKLMFESWAGIQQTDDNKVYLRPETAQGIFINFKNVVDTSRVRVPFGIAQTGKAFRNEVTPRNFTFRSREFEQMEIEFFCHPDDARDWYTFWRDWRMNWWKGLGLAGENLVLREHDPDELAHYAKDGAGTSDVEYRFPFTAPGFGELEGIAHRSDFDLRQHEQHSGAKLHYFDTTRGPLAPNGQPKGEHYLPHVIEPSAGLDRGVLAVLCEAYTFDESRPSKEFMRFHPRLAPIKAAVFPLVNKDGMPEIADKLTRELRARFGHLGFIETDAKQSIGKRYARMDEAGCPFCFTIDSDTLTNQTVTVRDRDTGAQDRIALDQVQSWLDNKLSI